MHDRPLRLVEVTLAARRERSRGTLRSTGSRVEAVPARSGGDLGDPSVLASYRYRAGDHLDGLLRQTVERHPGDRWELRSPVLSLQADPGDGTVLVSGSDRRLRTCCAAPLDGSWEVRTLRRAPEATAARRIPLGELRWNVAVWCSQGRLPDGMDPFAPVGVAAWPDLTRGVLTPSAMPVVALLVAAPRRPTDVAEVLGIPRTHAFVVLAALDSLGLLRSGPAAADAGLGDGARRPPADAERGVLRRLLGRLRVA
ncbi:MAG: hypothetical protein KF703_03085 [Actinobacteria bacterium]|nr:hypothetical protein [Actinomycetota bacterium]